MPIHTSSVSYELGCIHFLKQVLLPVRFRCTHNEFTHVALVHSAVIRKRNCAILGDWLPGVCYLRGKNVRRPWSAVRRKDFVRCPESGSVRFSEVANVLQVQLWYFQSVTRQVSVIAWVSARRVRYGPYGRFHCSVVYSNKSPSPYRCSKSVAVVRLVQL